jgi:LemA protein
MNFMWILIGVMAVVAVYVIFAYNNFVKLTQRAKEAWADIDVQLKRRYDLIPNLLKQ